MQNQNLVDWVDARGWSALVRIEFKTGGIPVEWLGDQNEWAMNYSLKPSVYELLNAINDAGPFMVDVSVRRGRLRR